MKLGLLEVGVPSALRSLVAFFSEPSTLAGGLPAVILRAFARSWCTRSPLLVLPWAEPPPALGGEGSGAGAGVVCS
jgi:hypothetical protein